MDKRILLQPYDSFKVDKLVSRREPKPSHVKRLESPEKLELIKVKIEDAPEEAPPMNSSIQTRNELEQMTKDIAAVGNKQSEIVDEYDSGFEWKFEELCKEFDVKWNKKFINKLIEESGDVILNLKYKWNRPRPFQLAPKLGIQLHKGESYTAGTPSFPSGHAAQSKLIADVLSKIYPLHHDAFQAIPEKVSNSRYIGGLHYPSDIEYGYKIGSWLADNTNTDSY
jgi:hypothetical protein